jgi:hypothetical protein
MLQRKLITFFLDSGAHGLYTEHIRRSGKKDYSFHDTQEFWDYVDSYAEYVKKNKSLFLTYVNVDVIYGPDKSREVQRYLENTHGLNPIPVVHFGTDLKILKKCMDEYEYIGLGGLGQEVDKKSYIMYGDRCFKMLCDDKGRPLRKTHGFAITSIEVMLRYPYFSVDSTTWLIGERYGLLIIPKKRRGEYDYSIPPLMPSVTVRKGTKRQNYRNLVSELDKEEILNYADKMAGFPYGVSEFIPVPDNYKIRWDKMEYWSDRTPGKRIIERVVEEGIGNSMRMRNWLNVLYFAKLEEFLNENEKTFNPEIEPLF